MGKRLSEAMRGGWLSTAIQVVVLAAVLLAIASFSFRFHPHSGPLNLLGYSLILVAAGSIALSPRWPVAAVGVALGATLISHGLGFESSPIDLALMVALFKAATPQHPWRTVALGVGTVLGYVAWQLIGFGQVSLNALVLGTLTVSAFLGVGYAVASQRLFARQRREDEIRRRVTEERLRIARELHDVVSHSISTINVQAGVAAHVIDERPETAKSALLTIKETSRDTLRELRGILLTIKETSRDTLRELRGILNVLRQFDDVESRQPAPGLAQLDLLVDTAARAGVPTTASIEGTARPLPAAVDLAAYRIIQESLTNVIRHAGRASARVTVAYEPGRVVIEVSDNGRGAAMQSDSTGWQEGHGLAGMRERAVAVDGELDAGPQPGRGFRVRASLPTNGIGT